MCSNEKLLLAKTDKAFVFRKRSFYISMSITLVVILTGITVSFTTVKLKSLELDRRLCAVENEVEYIDEIYYNLQHLFSENKWKWIGNK